MANARSFYVDDTSGTSQRDLSLDEVNRAASAHRGHLWVDVDSSDPQQAEFLKGIHGLHPLAVEDALSQNSRPKIEEYDGYLFIVILGVRFQENTPDPYDLQTYDLCLFLGPRCVITIHSGPSAAVTDIAQRIAKNPDLMGQGSDHLAHAVMDASVDEYFPLLDRLDDFVDDLEQRVITSFDEKALSDIFAIKRLVLGLRRHIGPEREVFNILTNRPSGLISPESQLYFRDIYDHVLRANDSIDTYRDLLSSVLDSYLTQVSNRLGKITKGLSVIATLSIPFVVVSGMWGVNVRSIPLSEYPHAFWWLFGIQLALGIVLTVILKIWKLL